MRVPTPIQLLATHLCYLAREHTVTGSTHLVEREMSRSNVYNKRVLFDAKERRNIPCIDFIRGKNGGYNGVGDNRAIKHRIFYFSTVLFF